MDEKLCDLLRKIVSTMDTMNDRITRLEEEVHEYNDSQVRDINEIYSMIFEIEEALQKREDS